MAVQSTRPQTLAYGLADSPAGQLAWIAEKFTEWTEHGVDRDALLTNVTLYWLTNTAGSSAQLYYEASRTWGRDEPSQVPTGVAVFSFEAAPRCGRSRSAPRRSSTGRSSTAAGTSPRWSSRTCSSPTSETSSVR